MKRTVVFWLTALAGILFSFWEIEAQDAAKIQKDSVSWMEVIFPPGYIQEGRNKGQGYEDVITLILQENLPEYHHDKIMGNVARMYHEFKQGKKVCNVSLFKTPEREAFMYFSIPSTFTLPNGLIFKKGKSELFGNADTVSLDEALKAGRKLGISRDRSYGKELDAILEKYKGKEQIFIHSGQDVFESLLKMLLADRLDCILGLPEEVMYVAEQMGVQDHIKSLALKENEGSYNAWLGCVACSKTDWGKQLIERINRVLMQQRPTERYRNAYERWLDASSIEIYRKLYHDVFLKTNE